MENERTWRRNINGHDEFSLASLVLEPLSMLLKRNFHQISLNSFEFYLKWNWIVLINYFHRFDRCHLNTHHFLIIGSDPSPTRSKKTQRKKKRADRSTCLCASDNRSMRSNEKMKKNKMCQTTPFKFKSFGTIRKVFIFNQSLKIHFCP